MLAPWVIDELKAADLNDERLNKRFFELVDQLAKRPTASIPAACGGAAETAAAYRWFDNEKVTFEKVLESHIESTRRRIATQRKVMLVQDTTEVDVTRPEEQVEGAGPLDGDTRRGALLHVLHAFAPDGVSLGTLHAMVLVRSDDKPLNATLNRSERHAIPIEDKESYRWVQTLRQAQAEAQRQPDIEFVCITDSEADIYELLVEAAGGPRNTHYLVRACQERALLRDRTKQGSQADLPASLRPQLLAASTM